MNNSFIIASMPRKRPDDRLDRLVECATEVFTALGYRRAQMADVAKAMGVAPGTLYLYVEGKEALFDLVLRRAYADGPPSPPPTLPVPTPAPGATLRMVGERVARGRRIPALEEALERRRVADARAELDGIIRALYRSLYGNRRAIKLVDRCALDYPELAAVWFEQGRQDLMTRLTRYLRDRIRRGVFRAVPDVRVAARVLIETIVIFAIHRHWDPAPQAMDEKAVENTLAQIIVNGLLQEKEK
jgi:AcrR family transcriptional regulator